MAINKVKWETISISHSQYCVKNKKSFTDNETVTHS
jgi:hypothetical protein